MKADSSSFLIRFCEKSKCDAKEALKACDAPRFKAYLLWRVENSRIKKESSIITYWKVFSMWYAQEDMLLYR
jgi:hypothetical protein